MGILIVFVVVLVPFAVLIPLLARNIPKSASRPPDAAWLAKIEGWHAPPELLLPVPRVVRLTFSGVARLTAAFLVISGGLFLSYVHGDDNERNLRRSGADAVGEIVRKRTTRERDHEICHLDYRFVAGGLSRQGSGTVSDDLYQQVKVGDPIRIRYLPSAAGTNRLAANLGSSSEYWFISLVFAVFACLMAYGLVDDLRKPADLLRHGQPHAGIILWVDKGAYGVATGAHYEFLDGSGSLVTGSASDFVAPSAGSIVTVLQHPQKPTQTWLYSKRLLRIRNPT